MCFQAKCIESPAASRFQCPLGDNTVSEYNSNVTYTCANYFKYLESKGRSVMGYCWSSDGQEQCCASCLSIYYFHKYTIMIKNNCLKMDFNYPPPYKLIYKKHN